MTLKECDGRLSEIKGEIAGLLAEHKELLMQWNQLFDEEKEENVACTDEYQDGRHSLYLDTGDSRLCVCDIYDTELDKDITDFYKAVYNSTKIYNIKNGRRELTEFQEKLVFAKAIEIRETAK